MKVPDPWDWRGVCACRVEGTPTLHSSQLLHQTGLLSPSSSCQEQSWPYFPLSSFCLPPLGSNPTFSLCGNGAGWSYLCSAPAHMAVPGLQQQKHVEEPVLEEMGLPTWDSGCYPGLLCPFSCLARCLRPPLRFVGPGQIPEWHSKTQKGHKALAPPLISRLSVLSPLLAALR